MNTFVEDLAAIALQGTLAGPLDTDKIEQNLGTGKPALTEEIQQEKSDCTEAEVTEAAVRQRENTRMVNSVGGDTSELTLEQGQQYIENQTYISWVDRGCPDDSQIEPTGWSGPRGEVNNNPDYDPPLGEGIDVSSAVSGFNHEDYAPVEDAGTTA